MLTEKIYVSARFPERETRPPKKSEWTGREKERIIALIDAFSAPEKPARKCRGRGEGSGDNAALRAMVRGIIRAAK